MRIPERVTSKFLEELDACEEDMEVFKKLWPNGCKLSERNLLRAAEKGLDINWFSETILTYLEYGKCSELDYKIGEELAVKQGKDTYWALSVSNIHKCEAIALWKIIGPKLKRQKTLKDKKK